MTEKEGDIHALVDEQISKDTDFQASLTDLDDAEKETAISEKKSELVKQEFASVTEKATKAEEKAENQKIRAEKAEAEAKKPKEKKEETETPKNDEQSNEPDYAKLAFLEGKGVKHPDDQKIIQDEAQRLKLPLTDILGMEHIKAKLKDSQDQREAEDGMPDGKGTKVGTNKTSVDYWKDKKNKDGSYATPDDLELAEKVIEARVKTEESGSKFSDDLYVG